MRKLRLWLSITWLITSMSLVTWWWVYALNKLSDKLDVFSKDYRMFLWEGAFLFVIIFAGGVSLIAYSYTDERRHQRLKNFFALFSHDIKTSITRVRLQSELLKEKYAGEKNPQLDQLMVDVTRLDLQLENSLWMSTMGDLEFKLSSEKLSKILEFVRYEFEDLSLELKKDVMLKVQLKAFESVLRNIIQNSILHGKATQIIIDVMETKTHIEVSLTDNGQGFAGDISTISNLRMLEHAHSKTNGIGLYLCSELIKKMSGEMTFKNIENNKGFTTCLKFKV